MISWSKIRESRKPCNSVQKSVDFTKILRKNPTIFCEINHLVMTVDLTENLACKKSSVKHIVDFKDLMNKNFAMVQLVLT